MAKLYSEIIKAITHIPSWASSEDDYGDKIKTTQASYKLVPLVYRSIRLRCDAISSVPVRVYNQSDALVDWPFVLSPSRFLRLTEASKLLYGAAFWLKLPNPYRPKTLDFINPFTMNQPKLLADGSLQFSQTINGAVVATWKQDDIVYVKDFFNPEDDIGPGVSAAGVALADSGLLHYMSRFSSKFFESGAMPLTIVAIDGTIDEPERKRVENFFKRNMTGISNAWRVLAMRMRGTMKPEVITPKISDMAMDSNYNIAAKNIEYAFGIPEGMLRSESNRASAEEHRKSFWQDTVRPSGQGTEDIANEQLFSLMGLRVELAFEDLDVFQADEAARAGSLKSLVDAGVPLLMAMEQLGYDLDDDQIAELSKKPAPAPVSVPTDNSQSDADQDLAKWERMAISRVRAGKTIRDFTSDCIPDELHAGISEALQDAKSEADVKRIFADKPEGKPDNKAEAILKAIELEVAALQKTSQTAQPINVTVHNHPGETPVVNITQEAQKAQEPPNVTVVVEPTPVTIKNDIKVTGNEPDETDAVLKVIRKLSNGKE